MIYFNFGKLPIIKYLYLPHLTLYFTFGIVHVPYFYL